MNCARALLSKAPPFAGVDRRCSEGATHIAMTEREEMWRFSARAHDDMLPADYPWRP
jgi:hypothetical protein